MEWWDRAACRGEELALFFPEGHARRDRAQTEAAKVICGGCPVREPCLRWVLSVESLDQGFGVVGGLTAEERRQLKRASPNGPLVHRESRR